MCSFDRDRARRLKGAERKENCHFTLELFF